MTKRSPRNLRPDEKVLWERVKKSAVPLHATGQQAMADAIKNIAPRPEAPEIPMFRIGQAAPLAARPLTNIAVPAIRMDAKRLGKIRKGKLKPQARIDLHGMTVAQAQPALTRFILTAHANGDRLVLVITGKGKTDTGDGPVPVRKGVLRQQVPQWLLQPPLTAVVQQVVQAHFRHGGDGALYVYLRRHR